MTYVYPTIPSEANHVTVSAAIGDENGMELAQNFSATLYNDPYREMVFEALIDSASAFLDQALLDNPRYDNHYILVTFRIKDQSSYIEYPLVSQT